MEYIDLNRYPLDTPQSAEYAQLVAQSRAALARDGLFNLPGFFTPAALQSTLDHVTPVINAHAFTHARDHNIFFDDSIQADATVLKRFKTTNHTICADQIEGSPITQLYDWPAFHGFLADCLGKTALYPMDDRIACANVMTYYPGEALNWHFDRAEFTTTLLLQAPLGGGAFEYVQDLRSAEDPNFAGIRALHQGDITPQSLTQDAGTLCVFHGVNTPHRVTPVQGDTPRIVAVFTFFETPNQRFSSKDRMGFYGRDTAWGAMQ